MESFYNLEGDNVDFETIPAKKIANYINKNNTIIIDLRDYEDYKKGHIPTAINIPYENLTYYTDKIGNYDEIVLYCDRGSLSLLAARELIKLEYKVINIYGGFHAYRGEISKVENHLTNLD